MSLQYYIIEDGKDFADRETYERLYAEALPHIGEDKIRMGEEELKEHMWNLLPGYPLRVWHFDGYVVGIESIAAIKIDGKTYASYRYPVYGRDQNGSKSWWYSEDRFRLTVEFYKDHGYAGVFAAYNPGSPASIAVKNAYTKENPAFNPNIRDLPLMEISPTGFREYPPTMRGFIIDLKED